MSALFLDLDRTNFFHSSPLASHGEVAKALPVVRLATKKLLLSVDAVVGLELLSTIIAHKDMATVLPNCVLVRLENRVTYIIGVNPLSLLCALSPPH